MYSSRRLLAMLVALLMGSACTSVKDSLSANNTSSLNIVGNPQVIFETNHGKLVVRLFNDKAPISTRNMLEYVTSKFYDGTLFHRVIPEYVVQGGGYDKDLNLKATRPPIKNEANNGLSNKRGTVAMARTNLPDSATSQFFINVRDNLKLDHSPTDIGYAVVGEVIEGMAVVDLIRNLPTRCPTWTSQPCNEKLPPGMRDIPIDPIIITKAYQAGK